MSTSRNTTGFVLAGGKSSRMGRDKALLEWHGRNLLHHMQVLLRTVCDPVIVVGREELPDSIPGVGPIGGILTALQYSQTPFNIIIAVDLPFLTPQFLIEFHNHCRTSAKPLTACTTAAGFPLCLGLRSELRPAIAQYIESGNRSLAGFICQTDHDEISGIDPRLFININSAADYKTFGVLKSTDF
jgi:molybdenum cofactor guanylyltransferase